MTAITKARVDNDTDSNDDKLRKADLWKIRIPCSSMSYQETFFEGDGLKALKIDGS